MTELDGIREDLRQLTEAFIGSKSDPATFDREEQTAEFETLIDAKLAAEAEKKRATTPVFKGDPVYAHTLNKAIAAGEFKDSNRYARQVKEIAQTGSHKDWVGNKFKAIDFWLAEMLMRKSNAIYPPYSSLVEYSYISTPLI